MPLSVLRRFSWILTLATFLLIVAGGLVTSTESGLAVPDWPLSYGQFFPPMIGGIRFEHSHRVIAMIVGLMTIAFAVTVFCLEKRKWVRALAALAVVAVVLQAILGAITVIYLLPTAVSVSHACLAQSFFCLVASFMVFFSSEWTSGEKLEAAYTGSIRRLLIVTFIFAYLQLVLGAIVRHAGGMGVNYHIAVAFLIVLHVLFIVSKISLEPGTYFKFFKHAVTLGALVLIQIFLGLGAFVFTLVLEKAAMPRTAEVLFASAHQSTGALILAALFTLLLRVFRLLKLPVKT